MSIQVNKIELLTCHHCGRPFSTRGLKPLSKAPCKHCQELVYVPVEFGHYHLYRRVGVDSLSVLFKAYDTRLERRVFLRIARGSIEPGQAQEMLNMARQFGTLIHNNITKVWGNGSFEGQDYVELESVRGEFVQMYIHQARTLSVTQAMRCAIDLTTSLDSLSKAGVRFGQLSPNNVVISKPDKHSSHPTSHKTILFFFGQYDPDRTPHTWEQVMPFMAPERIEDPELTDWYSDVYSLGAMIYYLIMGESHQQAGREGMTAARKPLSIKLERRGFDRELAHILEKMLARNPIVRDIPANELIQQFEAIHKKHLKKQASDTPTKRERHMGETNAPSTASLVSMKSTVMANHPMQPPAALRKAMMEPDKISLDDI